MESAAPSKGNVHKPPPSKSELLSSAKVVADAANAALHHEKEKLDKGKVAGAAADLLEAASHYGKLEEKGYGKYVEKAETYLHEYHSSHSATSTTTAGAGHSGNGGKKHESGYGEYLKMAEGLLKKH